MQDSTSAFPGVYPLFFIKEDTFYISDVPERFEMWSFGDLAGEEISCGLGEDEADGEVEWFRMFGIFIVATEPLVANRRCCLPS